MCTYICIRAERKGEERTRKLRFSRSRVPKRAREGLFGKWKEVINDLSSSPHSFSSGGTMIFPLLYYEVVTR